MRFRDICRLIEGTSDTAFVIDGSGHFAAWNEPAEKLLGLRSEDVIGRPCHEVIKGIDEGGMICSENCVVQASACKHHPIRNFDLQVSTPNGKRWCNVSVMIADESGSAKPYTIHILRQIDVRKRLERLVRDFLVTEIDLPEEEAAVLVHSPRSSVSETELTQRETEILDLLATGKSSAAIAGKLHISRNTVDNHTQHILKKLNAHSRLEAVRRAELAGLLTKRGKGTRSSSAKAT